MYSITCSVLVGHTDDATVTLINLLVKHLEGNGYHARLLFVDVSSVFKTTQPPYFNQ